jgi:hypothetical protein
MLGSIIAVVDYLACPGMFGSVVIEAIMTGIGVALLSYLAGTVSRSILSRRAVSG